MARRRSTKSNLKKRNRLRVGEERRLHHETLEQRQLLAALLGVNPNSGELIDPDGSTVLNASPTELTIRFDGGEQLRTDTLEGIRLVRSGDDGQFGPAGANDDVIIQPGYIGFADADETQGEQGRVVTMRFADPLPDDFYQLEIYAFDDPNSGITGLRSDDGEFFEPSDPESDREIIPFEIELGAQVISVVPQPVLRDSNGSLSQRRDQVVVYFNDDDLISAGDLPSGQSSIRTSDVTSGPLPTAIDPRFYQMILTRETVSGNDDVVVLPSEVEYNPTLDRAVLTFGRDQNGAAISSLAEIASAAGVSDGDGTFRLKIGRRDTVANASNPIRPTEKNLLGGDSPSSFETSDASPTASLGSLGFGGTLISEEIRATDRYTLPFPGGPTEPGHRDIVPLNHVQDPFGDREDGASAPAITTLYYNFNTSVPYGVSDNGQHLFNAITERQKQRVREIYEQLGASWGIDFVETESHVVDGVAGESLTVVVGDLVVFGGSGANNTSGPGGVFGGVAQTPDNGAGQAHTFGRRIALLDRAESWYNGAGIPELADRRLSFYAHAMNVIGSALGVGIASELPPGTSMSGVIFNDTLGGERDLLTFNPIEPALPGDHDNVHGQFLYRPESRDIDVYNFTVDPGQSGVFSAEVFAERLHESASLLDSRIALYSSDGVLIASNDDYFGEDSFLEVRLSEGDYYLAVSASGNDQYDLNVVDSGMGGTSEGRYDVSLNFRPDAASVIVDASGTPLDGDGDGLAGGDFNYWFRAVADVGNTTPNPTRPRTLFVDKTPRATPPAGTVMGTLENPYRTVPAAFAAARPGDIVRLVGNAGIDGNLSTRNDSYAYEIGRGGSLNAPLSDGVQMDVPAGVHVMIEAGAVFKLRDSRIGVGSSTTSVDRSGGSLQVLGTPFLNDAQGNPLVDGSGETIAGSVIFTSYDDETTGVDTNPLRTSPIRGNWGGIEFRNDIDRAEGRFDYESEGIFLNYVGMGDFRYGGGQVSIESESRVINPIHLTAARATLLENVITLSADAAISANPESFEETNFNAPRYQQNDSFVADYRRVGPDIRGNTLLDNSTNALFVRVDTEAGQAPDALRVAARFDDRDIVHFIGDTLIVQGTPGGPRLEQRGPASAGINLTTQFPPAGESSSLQQQAYSYRLTFVDAFGGESVPSNATSPVTPNAGQQITLSNLPAATGDFVSRRIYRSQPGGGGPFTLVASIDRSSQQFVDRGQSQTATLSLNSTRLRSRPDARLAIDAGVIVKFEGTRIETEFGAQLIAEGQNGQPVVFTSRADDRHGAGGTFDTNNDAAASLPAPGDWGGLYIGPTSSVSLDHALVTFGGGEVAAGGAFTGFNALEIIQAEGRVTNSTFERNASGLGSGQGDDQRDGHGFNEPAVIFVRGAQPVIVNNIIRDNVDAAARTAAISINVNALNSDFVSDTGRATGRADRFDEVLDNQGPLINGNFIGGNSLNGLAIRGGTLTTESVWDDTDIVHVVANQRPDLQIDDSGRLVDETILIPDFHTYGGLRLESGTTQSLVVKFDQNASIVANGRPLDIEDRIGGILQVLGKPGFPVVLTSLSDDDVGAGFDPEGLAQTDTNGDGPSTGSPGQWAGVLLDQFSHDRNVVTLTELESPRQNARPDSVVNNGTPANAQFLGELATGEKTSDENLRLGYTIKGLINRPADVDIYSFRARAGTEVWLDIDRTSPSLDTVVELVAADGSILALSDNSHDEMLGGTTLLANSSLLPTGNVNILQQDPFGTLNVSDGSFLDHYTVNRRDAGMRVVLPGAVGSSSTFFVRVRSSNQDPANPTPREIINKSAADYEGKLLREGKTSGNYELQIRLRDTQEQGGSTIRYSDIRFATDGITVRGVPGHSPLLGEAAEDFDSETNDTFANAPDLGALNATDRGALSVAGQLVSRNDIDWYQFRLQPESVDPLDGSSFSTPVILDIDYADGIARPNTNLWLFNSSGQLISFGTDSNIADDQPGPNQGVDQDDLSRGSAGPLDAWIGSLQLTGGDYFVAVSNNSVISDQIEQFQVADVSPAKALVRVEPVSSVRRISSDHDFDDDGEQDFFFVNPFTGDSFPLDDSATASAPVTVAFDGNNNRVDYTLSDVVLFVSRDNGTSSLVETYNPFTGALQSVVSQTAHVNDVAMRPDGRLYGIEVPQTGVRNDGTTDDVFVLDTALNGGSTQVGDTGIQTFERDGADAAQAVTNFQGGAPRNGDALIYDATAFIGAIGNSASAFRSANGLAMLAVAERFETPIDPRYEGNWIFRLDPSTGAGVSAPFNNRADNARLFGAGTQVVERGFLATDRDNRANATTAVLNTVAGSQLNDGDKVQAGFVPLEFDRGVGATVAGSVMSDAADGDLLEFTDSFGRTVSVEIDFGAQLRIDSPALINDGDRFTLSTASGTELVFEFDPSSSPTLTDPNHVAVRLSSDPAVLANNIVAAVNGLGFAKLRAVVSSTDPTWVDFTGDAALDTSGLAGVSRIGSYGTTSGSPVSVNAGMSATEFVQAIADTLNSGDVVNDFAIPHTIGAIANGLNINFPGTSGVDTAPSWLQVGSGLSTTVTGRFGELVADGDTFVVEDSSGNNIVIEFDLGRTMRVSNANFLNDGDTFSITDTGGTTTTFEFDITGGFGLPGVSDPANVPVTVLANASESEVADAIVTAVNGSSTPLFAIQRPGGVPEIDFVNDTAITESSFSLTLRGNYGTTNALSVPVRFNSSATFIASQIASILDGSVAVGGVSASVSGSGDTLDIQNANGIVSTSGLLSQLGVSNNTIPVPFDGSETAEEIASRLVEILDHVDASSVGTSFDAAAYGNTVALYGSQTFNVASSSAPFEIAPTPNGGTITGLTTVEVNGLPRVFAVSDEGDLFEVVSSFGGRFSLGSSSNISDYIDTIYDDNGNRLSFTGLEAGPRNLYGGALRSVLFGITSSGDIYAFDTAGRPQGVFMHGQRSISTGVFGASGLAFSNLDVNLWHVTGNRGDDPGHGVNSSPDDNDARFPAEAAGNANRSLYFGLEDPDRAANSLGNLFQGALDIGDTGIVGDYAGNYATYDFPGGAQGSMESNPLDLSGYAREDRPTLYFNYYLETENSNSDLSDSTSSAAGNMLDAFRIFAAGEDGFWKLVGTNNSDSDRLTGNHDEYEDEFDQIASGGSELVQELFDVGDNGAPDSWRQARIPLDDFAGEKNVRIRIDFSTAGSSALGHPFLGGEELRAKSGSAIEGGDVLTLQRVEPGFGGSTTLYTFEFDLGLDLHIPTGAQLNEGDYFWVDNQKYTFVRTLTQPAGNNQVLFSETDSAATITQRIVAEMGLDGLDEGVDVFVDPERPGALNLPGASSGFASANLPASFIASQPGVADGNLPISVHHAMTPAQVAAAVTSSFAEHLNDAGSRGNTQPYQVSNGYLIHLFGHRVTDPGPLGLSRHGIETEPFGIARSGNQGVDGTFYTQRLPGDEFGRFATASRTNPGSIRGANNAFEGVYIDDIIIGFRERGEMVTAGVDSLTSFVTNNEYEPELIGGDVDEVERGLYQLEIRRGPAYGIDTTDGGIQDFFLTRTWDTNYRFNESVALVAPVGAVVEDGQVFTVSDGTDVATFEFDDITLPAGNPNVGVAAGSGHVLVPFDPRMTSSEIGRLMRDAINTTSQQTGLDVTASMSDGADSDTVTSTGRVSTSSLVYLHGVATASRSGSFDFGDLNNNDDNAGLRPYLNDDVVRFAHPLFEDNEFVISNRDYRFRTLGDQNVFRDQGQLLISQNVISNSLNFGISIVPGLRDVTSYAPLAGVLPHPGPVRATLESNNRRLATSVTVFNNVLVANRDGGIEILGESDAAGSAMEGSVPFARIVNNTIYGGDASGNRINDTGIRVADNAAPTLLNNIVANLETGVDVDSSALTVIGTMLYHDNGTDSTFLNGNLGAFPLVVDAGEQLFLNEDPTAGNYNFYLADGSAAIDSSLNSLVDREYFVNVKSPLGIGASPILSPSRDLTGQLRVDDPLINTPGGIGQNVFVDRGAIDRSDFTGPSAALLNPQDNDLDGQDLDDSATYVHVKEGTIGFFELVLVENQGSGPDASTVTADSVTLTENGRLLREGVDYTFGFSATNRSIRLTPLSGIWNPNAAYEITLNNRDRLSIVAPQSTSIVDRDRFTITDTSGITATFEYDTGYVLQVPQTLVLTVPTGQGPDGFQDGDRFSITAPNGNTVVFEIATIDRPTGSNTRILINPGDPITAVRDAIFAAIQSEADATSLDLAPRTLGSSRIQLGSLSGHSIDPMGTPLTQSGSPGGIVDGTITYRRANGDVFRIELDSDSTPVANPGDVVVDYDRTTTPAELAADLAEAFADSPLGLSSARALENGLLSVGGAPGDTLDVAAVGLGTLGTPGVTGPLQLSLPAGASSDSYEGQTLVVSDGSKSITYEFTLDSNRLPGTQLIILQPGQDAAAVTARLAQAIDADFASLSPQIQNGTSLVLNEPVGSSVDVSNTQINISGVAGGAIPISVLPSVAFNRDVVAAQLLAAIAASPLNTGVFLAGGGTLLLDNTASIIDQDGNSLTQPVVGIKDLAGNNLLPNRSNQETQFTILMPGVELDYGDAPADDADLAYERGTDGALNPARHTLANNRLPRLGELVDSDFGNPFPGSDDGDDGVLIGAFEATPGIFLDPDGGFLGFLNPLDSFGTELAVDISGSGLLDAWVDFNQDGDWNDPGEQVFANVAVLPGENRLRIQTPSNAFDGETWARFRLSPTGNQAPQGVVIGGEVEDYLVTVASVQLPQPIDDDYDVDEDAAGGLTVSSASGVLFNPTTGDTLFGLLNPQAALENDVRSGTLDLAADGSFTYTPNAEFYGTDTFTYRILGQQRVDINDPSSPLLPVRSSEVGTVTITVNPVNDAPLVVDRSFTTLEDIDGGLRITAAELLAGAAAGDFDASIRAPFDESAQTLRITGINENPNDLNALADPPALRPDGEVEFTTTQGMLVRANFVDGALVDLLYFPTDHYNADNPKAANDPFDSFTITLYDDGVTVFDDLAGTELDPPLRPAFSIGTITLDVTPVNDEPIIPVTGPNAVEQEINVLEDSAPYAQPWTPVLPGPAGAGDENDQTVNYSLTVVSGDAGRVFAAQPTIDSNGQLSFDLAANQNGTVVFEVTPRDDGSDGTANGDDAVGDPVLLTISVAAVNDAPIFTPTPSTTDSNGNVQSVIEVLEQDDESNGVAIDWASSVQTGPTSATDELLSQDVTFNIAPAAGNPGGLFAVAPSVNSQGVLTFTPAADAVGTAVFVVTARDDGNSDPALPEDENTSTPVTLTIHVRPVNDAPRLDPAVLGTAESLNSDDAWSVAANGNITFRLREDNTQQNVGPQLYQIDLVRQGNPSLYGRIGLLDVFDAGPANEEDGTLGGSQNLELLNFDLRTNLGGDIFLDVDENNNPILLYDPPDDVNRLFSGQDSFSYTVTDDGDTWRLGAGLGDDPSTATNTVFFTLEPVNDAPQFTLTQNRVAAFEDAEQLRFDDFATNVFEGPPATALDETDLVSGQSVSFSVTARNPADEALAAALFSEEPRISPDGTLRFTPAPDQYGTIVFDVVLTDDGPDNDIRGDVVSSAAQPLTITIQPQNDAPRFANNDPVVFSLDEDNAFLIPLRAMPGEPQGLLDKFTVGPANEAADIIPGGNQTLALAEPVPASTPAGGQLTRLTIDGTEYLRYVPKAHFNGVDSFVYSVTDVNAVSVDLAGNVTADPRKAFFTVDLNVRAINDAPQFGGAPDVEVPEDAGENQPDVDPSDVGLTVIPDWATNIQAGPAGAVDENAAPPEGQFVEFTVVPDDPAVAAELFSSTTDGLQVTVDPDGTLRFRTRPDANGSAGFTVFATDNGNADPARPGEVNTSTTRSFTITVTPVNDPPSFTPGAAVTVNEDSGSYNQPWARDILPGPADEQVDQTVRFEVEVDAADLPLFQTPPQITENGNLRFTPALNAHGTVQVGVRAIDSEGGIAATETLTITIVPQPDSPVAEDDAFGVDENTVLVIDKADVLSNDADPDLPDDALTIVLDSNTTLSGATVTLDANNNIVYDPSTSSSLQALAPQDSLTDTFAYSLVDSTGRSSETAVISVVVSGVNDVPQVAADDFDVQPNEARILRPLDNDVDVDGTIDPSSLEITLQPAFGSVSVLPNGTIRYTPFSGFRGSDMLRYTVADNLGGVSQEGTITITSNESPVANNDSAAGFRDEPIDIQVLSNDNDPDGTLDPTSVVITRAPTRGEVVVLSNGTVRYVPNSGFFGTDSFAYTVADNEGRRSNVGEVSVRLAASRLQNPIERADVNNDGNISPIDALLVINYLNSGRPTEVPADAQGPPYVDVDGNRRIEPLDALGVINALNRLSRTGSPSGGEGESEATVSVAEAVPQVEAKALVERTVVEDAVSNPQADSVDKLVGSGEVRIERSSSHDDVFDLIARGQLEEDADKRTDSVDDLWRRFDRIE